MKEIVKTPVNLKIFTKLSIIVTIQVVNLDISLDIG